MLLVIGLFWLSSYGKVYAFGYGIRGVLYSSRRGRRRERMLERVEVIGGLDGYVVVVVVMFIYIIILQARGFFLSIDIKSFGYLDLFHTFVVDKLI